MSAYTIEAAHRDGRHASTHPSDRVFWVEQGCTWCAAALAGEVPAVEAEWIFEGPDPEVGIFGDLVVHECGANEEDLEATITGITRTPSADGRLVNEVTTLTCPACGETTTVTEQVPAAMVDEPGR